MMDSVEVNLETLNRLLVSVNRDGTIKMGLNVSFASKGDQNKQNCF